MTADIDSSDVVKKRKLPEEEASLFGEPDPSYFYQISLCLLLLWQGSFSDSAESTLQVEDVEGASVKALINAVYGDIAETSPDEAIDLCRLADRWQCGTVEAAVLTVIEAQLTAKEALRALEQPAPLPKALLFLRDPGRNGASHPLPMTRDSVGGDRRRDRGQPEACR